jgi:hypothetical protein
MLSNNPTEQVHGMKYSGNKIGPDARKIREINGKHLCLYVEYFYHPGKVMSRNTSLKPYKNATKSAVVRQGQRKKRGIRNENSKTLT